MRVTVEMYGPFQRFNKDGQRRAELDLNDNLTVRDLLLHLGMAVNDLPPAELARMREQLKPVAEKFAASYDQAFMRDFYAEMDRIRGKK